MNNPNDILKTVSPEEMLAFMRDPKFYLENFTKIKTKKRTFDPFILNEAQKDLFNSLVFEGVRRMLILKARQLGFSTAVAGFFYHDTIMNPGTTSVIIGYNREMTTELLGKIKLFYQTTPDELKPKIQYNSRYEMSFPNIDSKIIVLPSNESVGRGYTINNLLCTELAFWDKADEKMATLEASVPIDGRIVVESTPNGIGNKYHEMWVGENGYTKKEYGWWWIYTEEEIRRIEKNLNDPRKFAQEYGLQFLASGRMVFDQKAVLEQRQNILRVGDEVVIEDGLKFKVGVWHELRVYKPPVAGGMYVAGVDTSEGVEGGDFSVVTIFHRQTGEEVAFYRGLIMPDLLGDKLNEWGRHYNNALMVVEVNNHGLSCQTRLKQLLYPNFYFRPSKFDIPGEPISEKLGWKTSQITRPFMIDDLNKALRDRIVTFHSKETLDEMLIFVYNENGDMVPQSKKYHDDCIFSAGVSYQGFKVLWDKPLTQINHQDHLPVNFVY